MIFEIDVSGEDLLSKNFVVCIADKNSLIKGFKFNEEIVKVLSSKYGQGLYRYKKSKKDKANFKVRLYSIVIYYLFKSINPKNPEALFGKAAALGKLGQAKIGVYYQKT